MCLPNFKRISTSDKLIRTKRKLHVRFHRLVKLNWKSMREHSSLSFSVESRRKTKTTLSHSGAVTSFTPKSSVLVPWDFLSRRSLHFHIFLVLLSFSLESRAALVVVKVDEAIPSGLFPFKRLFVENSCCPWGRWSFTNQSKQDDVCWLPRQILDPLRLYFELILRELQM